MENQSAIKQSASMEKKMYGMFLKTPKIEKADPADLVEELKSSDPVIDLTVPNQPVSDSNFAKLNKDLNELIKIKQEEGKQPLLDILDQLTSSMMKEKSTKELAEKEDEPKKKHRPGPKFAKLKKDKSRRETASGNMSEVSLNTSGISIASSSDAIQEAEPTLKRKHSLSQSIDEPRSTKQKMGTSIKMETSEITLEDPVVSTSCEFEAVQVPTEQPLIICNVASLAIKPELVIRAEFAKFCRRVNPFKCMALDCNFSTAKLSEMKEHVLEHKGCKGSLKCAYCLVEARNVGDLVKHLKETHKNDIFQCRNCFYLAEDSIAIEEHNKTQHPMENLKIFFVKLNLD